MAKISDLQKHLDVKAAQSSKVWNDKLLNMDFAGDFTIADANAFFEATTKKSARHWAVSQELTVNHDAQKKIIDSM